MFLKDNAGSLYYKSDIRNYYLFEGKTNNNLTSDIIFIVYFTKDIETKLVDFIYGGFDNLQAIEETIKRFEKSHK